VISVKKWVLVLTLLVSVSLLLGDPIPARLNMRNGDIIECAVTMDRISFISDYGEFQMPMEFVKAIVFPTSGTIITSLKTIHKNEIFRGFLLEEYILADFEGIPMKFHKDTISWVQLLVEDKDIEGGVVQVMLKTGEQFYAEMLSDGLNIQTSYGVFSLSMDNVDLMEFEGEGNVLTKTTLLSGSEMRGIVRDDFIVVRLLSGAELSIAPGKIKTIDFSTMELAEAPEIKEIPDFLPGEEKKTEIPHNMGLVERGSFTFGDIWEGKEVPLSKVTFTYDFYIGKYEVTFDEYDEFFIDAGMQRPSDNGFGRGQRPVINVSWWDAIAYCNWLSKEECLPVAYDDKGNFLDKDGNVTTDPSKVIGYRLPTEAEWEYAARGGNKSKRYKYSGSDNEDDVAWYTSNSGSKSQEVGKKAPNELGIYDMSGNVWEWCSDWYGNYSSSAKTNPYNSLGSSGRVLRGGSWYDNASSSRVAFRDYYTPTFTYYNLGFRIARTAP